MKTFFGGQKSVPAPPAVTSPDGVPAPAPITGTALPRLPRGAPADLHMFLAEDSDWLAVAHAQSPIWVVQEFALGSGAAQEKTVRYRPSPDVQNNGSLWVHTVFTPPGASPDPADGFFDPALTFAKSQPLVLYLPKPKLDKGVNLLTGKNSTGDQANPEDVAAASNETVVVSFLRPNVTLAMVDDFRCGGG